jgi:hypothetical protein
MKTLEEPARPATPAVAHAPTQSDAGPSGARELLLVVLAGALLAVLITWPLVLHPGHRIAQDLGDPVRTAWQIAWTGHALLHHPTHLWQSNAFYPFSNTLAFSDSLLGYAPAGLVGHGEVAALVRYNLLFLFAYALAFVGAYLLGRELRLKPWAAAVVGVAFAYAPFRSTMNGHLHVISSGGIPLTLFLLLRGYRNGRRGMVFAGWAVAAWQFSLGFTLGLQLAYLLAVLALVALVIWWRRGRPSLPRALITPTVAGLVLCAAVGVFQARPYLKVSDDFSSAQRSIGQVQSYSASPKAFLAATPQNRIWSGATKSIRNSLSSPNETALFPGLAILALAVAGVTAGAVYSRGLRIGLGVGVLVCAVLSLGFGFLGGRVSYRLLYDYAPGWDGVRTPGRIVTLTSLGLALLAGAGAQRAVDALRSRGRLALAAAVALPVVVFAEGSWTLWKPHVPSAPAAQLGLRGPQLHLPMHPSNDRLYQFWSVDGFPKIYNGVSTFDIPSQDKLRRSMRLFPNRHTIQEAEKLGIRTILLHTDLGKVPLPPPQTIKREPADARAAAAKPVPAGLGVRVRREPGLVIYYLPKARS